MSSYDCQEAEDDFGTNKGNDRTVHPTVRAGYYRQGDKEYPSSPIVRDAIKVLLEHIGEDPKRQGLKDTPQRVAKALIEMTEGYRQSPKEILSTVFEENYDELVMLKNIPFVSLCEHHLLPFTGECDIGYISQKKVVGLSKLARLVDCFSKRLQVQERLTKQIADSIMEYLQPLGVAVVVKAQHSCMSCRGVMKSGSIMVTSVMLGVFREEGSARSEFLSLSK